LLFIAIWTCAMVVLINNWLVVGRVRPVLIPSLASQALLSPITKWNLRWFRNIQAVRVTFFFSSAWFWGEAIRCEIIVQFAKIMSSINNIFIIEWTLDRVINLSYLTTRNILATSCRRSLEMPPDLPKKLNFATFGDILIGPRVPVLQYLEYLNIAI